MVNKDIVFIVSGGRTGTTLFGEALGSVIPEATSFHEPDLLDGISLRSWRAIRRFGLYHMVVGRLIGTTGVRNLAQSYLSNKLSREEAVRAVFSQRGAFYRAQPTPMVIEAYYQWYGLLPVLREAFPKAKIAGIVRDPRTWVSSWLRFGGHHDEADRVAAIGQSRLNPEMIGDRRFADQWNRMNKFERLCWDWQTIYRLIAEFDERDDLCSVYKFEEIFGNDLRMRQFLSWITTFGDHSYACRPHAEALNRVVNASSNLNRNDWPGWPPQQAATLARICEPIMSRFGYGEEPEWRALVTRGEKGRS